MLKRLVSLRGLSDSPPIQTVLHLTSLVLLVLLPRFLIQRSSGIPHYCEELLRYLQCNNMLLLHTRRPDEGQDNWQNLIGKHPLLPIRCSLWRILSCTAVPCVSPVTLGRG